MMEIENKSILFSRPRYEIHSLQFKSDGAIHRMQIEGPAPGNWFGVAFISWTDPNNERIEQQGELNRWLLLMSL